MAIKMKLWDEIYMDWNGEKIEPKQLMDEHDHQVFVFDKTVDADITIQPTIKKSLGDEVTTIKNIQELRLKAGDSVRYEFVVHVVEE